jgi:type VI protein secretion system component VasF
MNSEIQLRASDADREAVVDRLAAHGAAGRLEAEELEERTAAALRARTVAQLEALEADLPAEPARAARGARLPALGRFRVYLPVIALLVAIWAVTGAGYFWPMWPALGWGVALLGPGSCGRSRRLDRPARGRA